VGREPRLSSVGVPNGKSDTCMHNIRHKETGLYGVDYGEFQIVSKKLKSPSINTYPSNMRLNNNPQTYPCAR
jgi:hypothetical protein